MTEGGPAKSRVYQDMTEVREANSHTTQDFFDPVTLRFFQCRVSKALIGGRYFVTSTPGPGDSLRYTTQMVDDQGLIDNVSGQGQYKSRTGARKFAQRCAKADSIERHSSD